MDKVKILVEIDKGVKKKDFAQMFKILASTLSTILKNCQRVIENQ